MRKDAGAVYARIGDVIYERSTRGIQVCQIPHPLGDFMISTRGIPTDAQSAYDLPVFIIERNPATKKDEPTCDLVLATATRVMC